MTLVGKQTIMANFDRYTDSVKGKLADVGNYFAPQMESSARTEAPWVDRTGNARQGLRAWVDDSGQNVVILYLAHSMEYGVYLETRYQSRYAILWPTVELYTPDIIAMLRRVFR